MARLLDLLGMLTGAWIGWSLGALLSIFVGFLAAMVGMGLGMYLIRRATGPLFP